MMLISIGAFAVDVQIGELYYRLDDFNKTAVVVSKSPVYSITSIEIPSEVNYNEKIYTVTSIGWAAFANCTNLISIKIPESVTAIGSYAFQGCSSLASITIPENVHEIHESTFESCTSLQSVIVSGEIQRINTGAFANCKSLKSVTLHSRSVPLIWDDDQPFYGCDYTLYVPFGSVGEYRRAFFGQRETVGIDSPYYICQNGIYYDIIDSDKVKVIANKTPYSGDITIPGTITEGDTRYNVVEVGSDAFSNCKSLTNVYLPNSIKTIGEWAFAGSNLYGIVIPNSVNTISHYAFSGSSLTSIVIPESVKELGYCAFSYCQNLQSVKLPKHRIDLISQFKPVAYGDAWESGEVFASSNYINEIYSYSLLPQSAEELLGNVIYKSKCTLYVPVGCSEVYQAAGWTGFKEIVELDNYESIALYQEFEIDGICYRLTSVNAGNLTAEVVKSQDKYSGALVIPTTVIFNGQEINVTSIGNEAFRWAKELTEVSLPASIISIGQYAFYYSGLRDLYCYGKVPPAITDSSSEWQVFARNTTLHIPDGCKEIYEANPLWAMFKEIVEMPSLLTIEYRGSGEVAVNWQPIESGYSGDVPDADLLILPADGYRIGSATLDEEDVLDQIVNHHLAIHGLSEPTVLEVEFIPESTDMAILSVKNGSLHTSHHYYPAGSSAVLRIEPETGWNIHSVTFNGEDVTDTLNGDTFTTSALTETNNLEVVYKYTGSMGVEEVEMKDIRLSVQDHRVTIRGKKSAEVVNVYDVNGINIHSGYEDVFNLSDALPAAIITVGGYTYKVVF